MSNKKRIHLIIAARPNIMKVAPLYHALIQTSWADPVLVHTDQHYDDNLSGALMRDFGLPAPHYHLGVGSGTHAEQTGKALIAYEDLLLRERPDMVVVFGDVNAIIACTFAAKKLNIPVAHMEAGLRSFDRMMPEEINRIATDCICDYLWTPSEDATAQLLREGVSQDKICEVGNIMIDAYCMTEGRIDAEPMDMDGAYAVVTFHRPANVDSKDALEKIVRTIENLAKKMPVIFPAHPRTRKKLMEAGLLQRLETYLREPLSYIGFMKLVKNARLIVTDSGGIQEETSYLGIPCLTLRTTTERPITVSEGTNKLTRFDTVDADIQNILQLPVPKRPSIKGWDGKAAARTVAHMATIFDIKE